MSADMVRRSVLFALPKPPTAGVLTRGWQDANVITPAQVAGLTAGIVVILICTGMSIYLCGRHKGCKEAAQRGILAISHSHHGHHQHTRLPDDARPSVSDANGKNAGGGRFAKLKEAFGVGVGRVASSTTTSTLEPTGEAPRMRATSPLQIHVNAGASSNSPHCGTDEFQAAVHNLLGYTQSDLREWYP